MGYPLNDSSKMEDAKNNIINILKMEGYKLNSGELFVAFKEAGGEMENFKGALEELTEEKKIQSDSDGNIMTVDDYQREKSQKTEQESSDEIVEDNDDKSDDFVEVENEDELESIIELKKETDSWLIEKLKNNGNDEELRNEIEELKKRVSKLEKIISNLTRAFD